jgi:hypothetical protein
MARICAAAGIADQRPVVGANATVDEVCRALAVAVARLDPHGLLVLTFTGHSDRRRRDEHGRRVDEWCLYDGGLPLTEVSALLAAAPHTARVIVVADTCYAGALARHVDAGCTVVLLGACADDQITIGGPTSEFAVRLEQLTRSGDTLNPDCVSYRWLRESLRRDTPDAERPCVWTNRIAAWAHRPFTVDIPVAVGATGDATTTEGK